MTGAGLTSCSGATSAVSWNSSTNLFGCNTISSSGGGGSSVAFGTGTTSGYSGTVTSSPTAVVLGDQSQFQGTLQGGSTFFLHLMQISPSTAIAAGALPNTVIASSIAAQIEHNIAGLYLSTNTISVSLCILSSTDTVIFASAPVSAAISATQYVYELPYSSNAYLNGAGQVIQITKVDTSTGPVVIKTQGTNLLFGTTTQFTMNAIGQTCEVIADGGTGWWPHGYGCDMTPPYLEVIDGTSGTGATSTSSNVVVCPFYNPVPVSVVGFRSYNSGSTSGVSFGIYNSAGMLLVSTGPVSQGFGASNYLVSSPVNIPPGRYNMAVQPIGVAGHFMTVSENAGNGTTICSHMTETTAGIPATFTFGTSDNSGVTAFGLVAGGNISP